MSFGQTPVSTTTLATNQFPLSAVYIQGTSGGNLTALQGGPASTADGSGNVSAPVSMYVYAGNIVDGADVTQGTSTDAAGANTVMGQLKQIRLNTASVTVSSLPSNASVNVSQVAGTATDTNTGNASAGTQRVVLASNQPAIPATQSGSWTVTANAGTNLNTSALALESGGNLATLAGGVAASKYQTAVASVTAGLSQANQIPVSNAGQQGKLTLSLASLTANSDNAITFTGNSTVARRIRIQNESSGTIYWDADTTASTGSPSLTAPANNAVTVEWVSMAISTLHIFVPAGGTTVVNGSGGVKISAWA